MQNKLGDLNNHLFEQIERLNDESLTDEELQKEMKRGNTLAKLAIAVIKNEDLALKAIKTFNNLDANVKNKPKYFELNEGKNENIHKSRN